MNSFSVFDEHKKILSLMCDISAIGFVEKISCQSGKIQETRKLLILLHSELLLYHTGFILDCTKNDVFR